MQKKKQGWITVAIFGVVSLLVSGCAGCYLPCQEECGPHYTPRGDCACPQVEFCGEQQIDYCDPNHYMY